MRGGGSGTQEALESLLQGQWPPPSAPSSHNAAAQSIHTVCPGRADPEAHTVHLRRMGCLHRPAATSTPSAGLTASSPHPHLLNSRGSLGAGWCPAFTCLTLPWGPSPQTWSLGDQVDLMTSLHSPPPSP